MARTVTNRGLAAKIRYEFDKHPGIPLYRKDLADTLQVPETAIPGAVTYIRGNMNIETLAAGQAWRYVPGPMKNNATLFELIGQSKTGTLILQDENGRLFTAKEID